MLDVKRWCLGWILLTLAVFPAAALGAELRILAIAVNEQPSGIVAPVLFVGGRAHLTPDVFERLRIRLPDVAAVKHQAARYYPLDGLADVAQRIDERDQTLYLAVAPRHLMSTTVRLDRRRALDPTSSDYGGFLNYDLLGEWLENGNANDNNYSANGFFEAGIYTAGVVGTTTQALRQLDDDPDYVRLESTIVRDAPDDRMSYRVGDSISRGGQWGRPIRLGGIQVATNFDTQPDFVTFPTLLISGDAALPSSVDILAGNSSRFSDDIPAGPFVIEDVPVVTGAGEVTAVVTDVLGRQTVISQAYYASPRLLRDGLHDFSFELGMPREAFGEDSFNYDDTPVFVSTHRYGFSDAFTGEIHAEIDDDRQAAGVGAAVPIDVYGVISGSVAGSLGDDQQGGLFQLGFERSARDIGVTAFGRITTGDFTDLGTEDDLRSTDAEARLQLSLPLGSLGVVSSSYTYRHFNDQDDDHIVSGTYSVNLSDIGALNVTVLSTFGATDETVVTTNLTIPLGARTTSAGRVQVDGDDVLKTAELRHNAPLEGGFGGFASFSHNGFTRTRGEVSFTSQVGAVSAGASHVDGDTGVRLNAVGGIAFADGDAFLSRRIVDSFAVASVPGQSDVRVYAENRLIGRTDSDGRLLIHNLRAYERNRIRIDPRDLPLDADIGRTSTAVAPMFRSGVTVEFPVVASRPVMLAIYREDGAPVPPGSAVRLGDQAAASPVGFDGQVVLRGAKLGDRVTVDLGPGACAFVLDREVPDEPIPDLGRFVCQGGR